MRAINKHTGKAITHADITELREVCDFKRIDGFLSYNEGETDSVGDVVFYDTNGNRCDEDDIELVADDSE